MQTQQFSQFDKRCSCGKQIAYFQKEFEELDEKYLLEGIPISERRRRICKELNFTKLCCLESVTTYPNNFISDCSTNAYCDISNNNKNNKMGNNYPPGEEFLPLKTFKRDRDKFFEKDLIYWWGFNPNAYCDKINELNRPLISKLGYFITEENISFCNFHPDNNKSSDYPLEINLPNFF